MKKTHDPFGFVRAINSKMEESFRVVIHLDDGTARASAFYPRESVPFLLQEPIPPGAKIAGVQRKTAEDEIIKGLLPVTDFPR